MPRSALRPLLLLAALLLPTPALADDPPEPIVQMCVQTPVEGRTLGHVRLVVDDTWYERRTPEDDTPHLDLYWAVEGQRDRKSRAFLAALPPVLRLPITARPTWGESNRGPVPGRDRHPDGSEYWPFTCVDIPATPDQHHALTVMADFRFPDDSDTVLDREFRYLRDNCTTWICHLLADALEAAPSGHPSEPALLTILRKHRRPTPLLRALQAWAEEQRR